MIPAVPIHDQLCLVMKHMHHGIVIYDQSETIVVINRQVSSTFGFAEAAVPIGSTLSDYLHCIGATVGWARERVERVLDNHRAWSREGTPKRFDHLFDDGRIFEISFHPIASGGAVLTFADITHDRAIRAVAERRGKLLQETSAMLDKVSRISSRNRVVALNASIEAARMGHNGAGLAVVADEVRDLGRQTSDLLSEMREIIQSTADAD